MKVIGLAALFALAVMGSAQAGDAETNRSWPNFGGTQAGMRYSAIDQINRENVGGLVEAWRFSTGEMTRRSPEQISNSSTHNTPVMVAGSIVVCTPFNRVIALDPATGAPRWVFDAEISPTQKIPSHYNCRGVTGWLDDQADPAAACAHRIFVPTNEAQIISIDAKTGKRCERFGDRGAVSLPQIIPSVMEGEYKVVSAPIAVGGLVITGSNVADNIRADAPRGTVYAFDARTGALRWRFETIPQNPNDPAYASWENGGAHRTGAANVWSTMAADEERDLVFLPVSTAAPDFWGGGRPGNNHYSSSLVALRASTGEVVWHYQLVHHDIWDYDVSAPPLLITLTRDGVDIPAVVQNTKQGFVFVFNRETGEPLFPIEELPVPQEALEGEWLSPTQPFPKPELRLIPTSVSVDDAWGFTFLDQKACRARIASMKHGEIFTPPWTEPGTIMMPGNAGGANWGGPAYDPERKLMIVNLNLVPQAITMLPREEVQVAKAGEVAAIDEFSNAEPMAGAPYAVRREFLVSPFGAPCVKPPWGELVAVDMVKGEVAWRVPLGSIENDLPIPIEWNLGQPNVGGPVVTAGGLVFIAATRSDQYLRAFNSDTGEMLWKIRTPAGQQATPMTYEADGRQFVAMMTGRHMWFDSTRGDEVVAYALPKVEEAAEPAETEEPEAEPVAQPEEEASAETPAE